MLRVLSLSAAATRGRLVGAGFDLPCALGRSGRTALKREGDGASPRGRFALLYGFWRPDRLRLPRSGLATTALRPDDGWCDDPADRNYNRPVRMPYPAPAERLWRDDGLYDVVLVLDQNFTRRTRGRGSAIFLHCAATGMPPTAGCVALRRGDLVRLLGHLRRGNVIEIR